MSFLTINGVAVAMTSFKKNVQRTGSSNRTFNGTRRSTVRVEKRTWSGVTDILTDAAASAIEAAIANAAQIPCSGDALQGATVTCEVELGDVTYETAVSGDAYNYMRALNLTLYEV